MCIFEQIQKGSVLSLAKVDFEGWLLMIEDTSEEKKYGTTITDCKVQILK